MRTEKDNFNLGICTHQGCKAKGKKVWCNWGFKKFNWTNDFHRIKCPACHSRINEKKVVNVGYRKCYWKVEGSKRKRANDPYQKVKGVWKYANDNGVTTYVLRHGSLWQWAELVITTSEKDPKLKVKAKL